MSTRIGTDKQADVFDLFLEKKEQFETFIEFLRFLRAIGLRRIVIQRHGICARSIIGSKTQVTFNAFLQRNLFGQDCYTLGLGSAGIIVEVPDVALLLKLAVRHYKVFLKCSALEMDCMPFHISIRSNGDSYFFGIGGEVLMAMRKPVASVNPRRNDVGAWVSMQAPAGFFIDRSQLLKILSEAKNAKATISYECKAGSIVVTSGTDLRFQLPPSQYHYGRGPVHGVMPYPGFLSRFLRMSKRRLINVDLFANCIQVWIGSPPYSRTVLNLRQ